MTTVYKRLKLLFHALLELLRNLLLGWLVLLRALPLLKAILERRLRPLFVDRPRRDSARRCMPVHEKVYRRPDPLIYSQQYLMAQGLGVTWDNPDISILQGGIPLSSHALLPDTEYEIKARVWNGSTNAPAVHLPVHFSYLSFGMGTVKNAIGKTFVNLGAKGSLSCPAFASVKWRTPKAPGHYCLQVELIWSDDANPLNNLGQTNTDVQPLNSPKATFAITVRNDAEERRVLRFEADGYVIHPRVSCAQIRDDGKSPQLRRERNLRVHGRQQHPLPDGWRVEVEPPQLDLLPNEEQPVKVTLIAPVENFVGRQAINLNAFAGDALVGGVTLYAEGAANG
jgi:hypothetical protein